MFSFPLWYYPNVLHSCSNLNLLSSLHSPNSLIQNGRRASLTPKVTTVLAFYRVLDAVRHERVEVSSAPAFAPAVEPGAKSRPTIDCVSACDYVFFCDEKNVSSESIVASKK